MACGSKTKESLLKIRFTLRSPFSICHHDIFSSKIPNDFQSSNYPIQFHFLYISCMFPTLVQLVNSYSYPSKSSSEFTLLLRVSNLHFSIQRMVKKCLIYWMNKIKLSFVYVGYQRDISSSSTSWCFSWLLQWPRINHYSSCPTQAYWDSFEEDITALYACFTFLKWLRVWQRICYFSNVTWVVPTRQVTNILGRQVYFHLEID